MAVLKQDSSANVCYLTLCKFSMKLKKMAHLTQDVVITVVIKEWCNVAGDVL